MQKFYDLIESKGIREHCEKQGYKLNTWQCVYLVYISGKIPMETRHALYEEIMATMPEPEMCEGLTKPLYEMVREEIELEKKRADEFLKAATKKVYESFYEKDTLKKMIDSWVEACSDPFLGSNSFNITNTKNDINAYFTKDGQLNKVDTESDFEYIFCEDCIRRETMLPTPFKPGDILCFDNYLQKNQPCIYVSMHEYEEDIVADFTYADINSCDYTTGKIKKGTVPCEELDYFEGEFEEKDEIIKVLSDYLKGNIDIATLMNMYVIHLDKVKAKELEKYNCIKKGYSPHGPRAENDNN